MMNMGKHKCVGFSESNVAIWEGIDCDCYYQQGSQDNTDKGDVEVSLCLLPNNVEGMKK